MHVSFFPHSERSQNDRLQILKKMGDKRHFTEDYIKFGRDYFDNPELGIGYGGYRYDGRFAEPVAKMVKHYSLKKGDRVLEIGCAKGHVLVEFQKLGIQVSGVDYSQYAVDNAHPDVRNQIRRGDASVLPFSDRTFDLVFGKEVLPHVKASKLSDAIRECMRVSKGKLFFDIQAGRNEAELECLRRWDTTHETLQTDVAWDAYFSSLQYPGDVYYRFLFPNDCKLS